MSSPESNDATPNCRAEQSRGNASGLKRPLEAGNASPDSSNKVTPHWWTDEEPDIKIPKPRGIWHGVDGLAVTIFGIVIPSTMLVLTCLAIPKRVTLVVLNHPLEAIIEIMLATAIPVINYLIWSSLCANKIKFIRLSSLILGVASGTSLIVFSLCIAAMFPSSNQLLPDLGSDFANGFSCIAVLSLLVGVATTYIWSRLQATRIFAGTKKQVAIYAVVGIGLSVLLFVAAEARPWCVRIAEHMSISGSNAERKKGLTMLRFLNPERDLRIECSDPRAAGICGLFIPVKTIDQHELYYMLTGTPYSFREFKSTDLSAMPDDYLCRNVIGDRIDGFSLVRSTMTGNIHTKTMSATLDWTFVFKNNTVKKQEARAEIGLPPQAVITGLTVWTRGEAREATFKASGRAKDIFNGKTVGQDTPAIVTDLGRGRVLMQCYPVLQEEESKVNIKMVVPLNPYRSRSASLIMPKFIATNFDLAEGEYALRIHGSEGLSSGLKTLKSEQTPEGDHIIGGTLTDADLKSNQLLIDTQRSIERETVAILDPQAWRMAKEEHKRLDQLAKEKAREGHAAEPSQPVIVMVDGSKGIDTQVGQVNKEFARLHQSVNKQSFSPVIRAIPARYVVETVERVSAAAPKHLVVVIDGSITTKEYKDQLCQSLSKLPASIQASFILACQENEKLVEAVPLSKGLVALKNAHFIGGHDNLKAMVKAAELAGETKGGAVLWIHGPQPAVNQEIYIMSPYTNQPSFYEMTLGTGATDTYEFFRNYPEIGPFTAIPRNSNKIDDDMNAFFGRWTADDSSYAVKLAMTTKKPTGWATLTANERKEVLTLNAAQRVRELIAFKRMHLAAEVAVSYGFVSPVSSALVTNDVAPIQEGDSVDAFSDPGSNSDKTNADALRHNSAAGTTGYQSTTEPTSETSVSNSASELEDSINDTIGSQRSKISVIQGVNTERTVRVNNLANLEALLNILANGIEILAMAWGGPIMIIGFMQIASGRQDAMRKVWFGAASLAFGLATPGTINWLFASARDANLFS